MSTEIASRSDGYRELIASFAAGANGGTPAWLADFRRAGANAFAATGFPDQRREDWKHGTHRALTGDVYRPVAVAMDSTAVRAAASDDLPGCDAHRLVFVDGHFAPEASRLGEMPAGVSIARLTETDAPAEFGELATLDEHGFSALNAAFLADGALLRLEPGTRLDRPLHVLHLSSGVAGALSCPRLCVVAGEGSEAVVIESFAGLGGDRRLVSAVAEIRCEAGSRVDHIKLQREPGEALHIGRSVVRQEAGSRYRAWEITLAGAAVRKEIDILLAGSGARCELNSLYLGKGERQLDNRIRVTHAAAGCETHEVYKGILDDRSQGVFDGLIFVERDAQQTDARQTNRNLLLSDDAVAYSMPRLEIYADDVKCTHGSTTGQLDDEQLFYLRARGIGSEDARALLTYAFAGEVVDSIEIEPVRRALAGQLLDLLPQGDRIKKGA